MKTVLLFILFSASITGSYAQSAPAKAPPRKSTSKKSASSINTQTGTAKPSTALPSKPTPTITPAANRSNSEQLPETTKRNVAAQPVRSTPGPAKRRSTHRATVYNSGGLGFDKNDKLLNIGVGLSSYYYGNPIGVSYESGITEDISIGGQFDYNSGRLDDYYGYNYRYRYSAFYLGVRGSYHFNRILRINTKKVDLYAGLGLGYQSFKWNDTYYGSGYGYNYGSGIFLNYFIGGKYYFTDKVGAFLELGYTGLSSSRVGLAIKF